MAAADTEQKMMDRTIEGFRGFTQDCLTGIDQIDEEHRKLFSLINEAVELTERSTHTTDGKKYTGTFK